MGYVLGRGKIDIALKGAERSGLARRALVASWAGVPLN